MSVDLGGAAAPRKALAWGLAGAACGPGGLGGCVETAGDVAAGVEGSHAVRATRGRQHGGRDDGDRLGRGRALRTDGPFRPEPRPGRGTAPDRARSADFGPIPGARLSQRRPGAGRRRRSISSGTCSRRTSSGRSGSATRSSFAGPETTPGRWSPTRRSTASPRNAPTTLPPICRTRRRPRPGAALSYARVGPPDCLWIGGRLGPSVF